MWSRHVSVSLKNSSPAGVSAGRGYMEICAGFKSDLSRPNRDTVVSTPQVVLFNTDVPICLDLSVPMAENPGQWRASRPLTITQHTRRPPPTSAPPQPPTKRSTAAPQQPRHAC